MNSIMSNKNQFSYLNTAGEEARSDEEETWERVPLAWGEEEEVRAREDGFREGTGEGQGGHEEEWTKVCFIRY